MQIAARYAAAIEILDDVLGGAPAEKALTGWARSHRFAGSKDRAAIRDHVFDALRMRRSCAALGRAESGRGIVLGLCLRQGIEVSQIFSGVGHAPVALSEAEQAMLPTDPVTALMAKAPAIRYDCPDWIFERFAAQFGDETSDILKALQNRAPVFLRVNALKATREEAIGALAEDNISVCAVCDMSFALKVIENERKIRQSAAFRSGMVELQDLSSQASVSRLTPPKDARVLDYCAGGGGKTLALAAHPARPSAVFAHDVAPERLRDLPVRAARAGAQITILPTTDIAARAPFDLVFVDAPCSGSGTWRRTPDAKWRLSQADLENYINIQLEALQKASKFVSRDGVLCYATCSFFQEENEDQVSSFLRRNPDWALIRQTRFDLSSGGDGFFCASMQRNH